MCSRFKMGEIVISIAGRDFGRCYIVIGIKDKNYVLLADGDKKRIEYPKPKNVKHLQSTGNIVKELAIWLNNKKRIRNEDLKKTINKYKKNEEAN